MMSAADRSPWRRNSPGPRENEDAMNRRVFLRAGLLAPLGLGLADAMRLRSVAQAARAGSAKACILLYMTGGPAQQETFDPKPNAPERSRGEFRPIATHVTG